MTILLEKSTSKRLEISNDEIDRFDVSNSREIIKKLRKLFKSQKLAKSGKKLLKSENLPNFGITEARRKFLTLDTKITFNYLWLIFTKTPIL